MSEQLYRIMTELQSPQRLQVLKKIKVGIEKEGLRIHPTGRVAQTPHPDSLGSPLTHPKITTDYSEAMLEFITTPHENVEGALDELLNLHRYNHEAMDGEYLWAGSMPGKVESEEEIPIAQYGVSNIGTMKHVYRKGLAYRYGRKMQAITGIHYNFSIPEELWKYLHKRDGADESLKDFKSKGYFAMIRNFSRHSWLLTWLFGASPALDRSFLRGQAHKLEDFDSETLYQPYSTSLRMSDLGYQSNAQESIKICYEKVESYIESIHQAVMTPYEGYKKIGIKVDGEYKQLNDNLLQIENEYYSPIRPKQVAYSGEKPIVALRERGVEYIEVRLLDINPMLPVGIDATQSHFLNTFLLFCFLDESPLFDQQECEAIENNRTKILVEGRKPNLSLTIQGEEQDLKEVATDLLNRIGDVAKLLDASWDSGDYGKALQEQRKKVENMDLLPSQQILNRMKKEKLSYSEFIQKQSIEHSRIFSSGLSAETREYYKELAVESKERQKRIEQSDNLSFDEFLKNYFQNQ